MGVVYLKGLCILNEGVVNQGIHVYKAGNLSLKSGLAMA